MKGREGGKAPKQNIDQAEPLGAFVGAESVQDIPGTPPRWSKGKTRVSGSGFMAEGESAATSVKAARTPTHWRRGGFVSGRYQEGGKTKPPSDADFDEEKPTNYKSGGWMKGAVKHPGALHRSLGVPQGQKIPAAKIAKAAHSSNPTLRKRAVLAQTFAKFRPK